MGGAVVFTIRHFSKRLTFVETFDELVFVNHFGSFFAKNMAIIFRKINETDRAIESFIAKVTFILIFSWNQSADFLQTFFRQINLLLEAHTVLAL